MAARSAQWHQRKRISIEKISIKRSSKAWHQQAATSRVASGVWHLAQHLAGVKAYGGGRGIVSGVA